MSVFKYMRDNDVCTSNYILYQNNCLIFESYHEFKNANKVMIEGLEKGKVENLEALRKAYSLFEQRMEKRMKREKTNSAAFTENELDKVIANEYRNAILGEYSNKPRKYPFEDQYCFKKRTLEENIFDSTAKYGNVQVYVDEEYRSKVIEKGTILVDKYVILLDYLIKNDKDYRVKNDAFIEEVKMRTTSRPYSWINGLRILPEQLTVPEEGKLKVEKNKDTPEFNKTLAVTASTRLESNQTAQINPCSNNINKPNQEVIKIVEDNGKKFKFIKVDKPVKEAKMYIDVSKLFIGDEYISPTEFRVRQWYATNNKAKSSRRTIICKVDQDGDLIMSSDEEDELPKDNKPKSYVFNSRNQKDQKPELNKEVKNLKEGLTHPIINAAATQIRLPDINTKTINNMNCVNNKVTETFSTLNNRIKTQSTFPTNNAKQVNKPTSNLNLFNTTTSIDELAQQCNIIDEYYNQGKITLHEKTQYLAQIDEQLRRLESRTIQIPSSSKPLALDNPFLKTTKNNDIKNYLEPNPIMNTKPAINPYKPPEPMFTNVSRSLDFSNIKVQEGVNQYNNIAPTTFTNLFPDMNEHSFGDKENNNNLLFDNTPESSKRKDKLFRAFIKDTPELKRSEKEKKKHEAVGALRNNFNPQSERNFNLLIPDNASRQQQLAMAFGGEITTNSFGLSIVTEGKKNDKADKLRHNNYK
jgi:hypothetical protein